MLKITKLVKKAVATYKAQRVKAVVDQYIGYCDAQLVMTMPVVMEFYRRSVNIVVDKTAANPAPALALADAMEQCVKHYGPALKIEWLALAQSLEERHESKVLTTRLEQLMEAVKNVQADVNTPAQ